MNIFDFAMQMEKDGEAYYRELRQQTNSAGLKNIFAMLAEEEVKHYRVVEQLRNHIDNPQLAEADLLTNVKNVFVKMQQDEPRLKFAGQELDLYRKARDIEEASRKFYLEKSAAAEQEDQKQLLRRLAQEEDKHLRIMENIVEFVSRPEPGQWLENAEWYHLEEY